MDSATLALLSDLVGKMAKFYQEYRGRKETKTQATLQDYIEWLERGRHTELVDLLRSNQDLMAATDRFMRAGHDEILDRFDRLEEMLTKSLISTPGWAEIMQSLNHKLRLSDQAYSILQQFDTCEASVVYTDTDRGKLKVYPLDGKHGQVPFNIKEQRFLEDDLETLAALGLLLREWGQPPRYKITRVAVDLVRSIPSDPA